MKLIIYPDVDIWDFVLSGLKDRTDVQLFALNKFCNIIQKGLRKYDLSSFLPAPFLLGSELRRTIQRLCPGDSLVLAEYTEPALITALSKIIPEGVSRYVWLWNHKGNNQKFKHCLSSLSRNHFQVVTYDELDAESFGFKWHTQFFNIKPYQATANIDYPISFDFLFVGYAKNREEEIESILSLLSDYSCKFVTVHNNADYIPYREYMEMARHARCIVEIVRTGDPSCTLRPLEALATHRKLLTNNPSVRRYSFYNPQNIFILGEDDTTRLSEFILSPFEELPSTVVDCYDVNTWVDTFR